MIRQCTTSCTVSMNSQNMLLEGMTAWSQETGTVFERVDECAVLNIRVPLDPHNMNGGMSDHVFANCHTRSVNLLLSERLFLWEISLIGGSELNGFVVPPSKSFCPKMATPNWRRIDD